MRKAHALGAVFCLFASPAVFTTLLAAQAGRGNTNPQELLNRSADAVLKLKSAQFTLNREGTPAVLDEKNGITFTNADCIYAAPDRVSCNVKIASRSGTILQLTRVWVPEGAFQSNPLTRQFAKAPPDAVFNGVVLFAKTGIPEVMQKHVQKPQVVGNEKLRDKNAVHLKGEVTGEKLNPLMGNTLKPELLYAVDMWMEDTSNNPLRIHVQETGNNGWMIDLFGTNAPVDIPTPKLPPTP